MIRKTQDFRTFGSHNEGAGLPCTLGTKAFFLFLSVLVFGFGFSGDSVKANEERLSDKEVACGGGGGNVGDLGGEYPWPFTSNQKVELADGEYYVLIGHLRHWYRDYHLEVDLDAHPWLASQQRKFNPYYTLQIDSDLSLWQKLKNKKVRVVVRAQGVIREENSYEPARYELALKPISRPLQVVWYRK